MGKIKINGDRYEFMCPGCGEIHQPSTSWKFTGSLDLPTLAPSVLVTSGCYVDGDKENCWCSYNAEQRSKGEPESGFVCGRCHSFVRDGKIQFLNDSTHKLAGQTVELPEIS